MSVTLQGIGQSGLSANPAAAMVSLFFAGVATSFFPCIYPMIPITAGLLGGSRRSGAPRSRIIGLTMAYVLGLSLFYALLGLIAWMSRQLFGALGSTPSLRMSVLLVVVGLCSGTLAALPRASTWMTWIKRVGGIILMGMAEYYFIQVGKTL